METDPRCSPFNSFLYNITDNTDTPYFTQKWAKKIGVEHFTYNKIVDFLYSGGSEFRERIYGMFDAYKTMEDLRRNIIDVDTSLTPQVYKEMYEMVCNEAKKMLSHRLNSGLFKEFCDEITED